MVGAALAAGPANALEPFVLGRHECWIRSLDFSPDGAVLAAAGGVLDRHDELILWDLASGRKRLARLNENTCLEAARFSRDGQWLAVVHRDQTVKLLDARTGSEETRFSCTPAWRQCFAFSADSRQFLVLNADGSLAVWNMAEKRLRVEPPPGPGQWLVYARGREALMTGQTWSGVAISIWDLAARKELVHLEMPTFAIWAACFSPDGDTLALGTDEGAVYFCHLPSRRVWSTQVNEAERINCLAFSPDARTLVSGGQDHTVKLWDVATGEPIGALGKHDAAVFAVAFAPDGRRVASGGFDKLVRLWETPSP